jgi:Ion channel
MRLDRQEVVRVVDSYASLLVLLLANFFVIELVTDARWGAVASILLAVAALIVAISDPDAGEGLKPWHWVLIGICVALTPVVLLVTSSSVLGVAYLVPVGILVSATLPVTLSRIAHHKRVTAETILGATCAYILFGLLFAFVYLALGELRDAPFFAQPGPHEPSEYLYFSFVALTTLGFGDLSPSVGLPQALTVLEALLGSVFLVTLVARLVTLWVRQDELGHAR